jgi:hypothetical protein
MKRTVIVTNRPIASAKREVINQEAFRKKLISSARNGLFSKVAKRSIDMFFGRCKHDHNYPISIKEMDEAIMKAVSYTKTRQL